MVKVLFVCHGNICRSTMAQYVLQDMVRKRGLSDCFTIDSAATSTEEIGNGVHGGTKRVLAKHGVPCGNHRARQVRRAEAADWDLIVGMDAANIRNLERMLGPQEPGKVRKLLEFCGSNRDVADPWYTGDFETTYDDVVAGCVGILEHLGF